jgi:hypothetical protein
MQKPSNHQTLTEYELDRLSKFMLISSFYLTD